MGESSDDLLADGDAAAAAALDQSLLAHLLGYRLVQADIRTKAVFEQHIGQPMKLRPAEFTVLLLLRANPGVTQKQLSQALAVSAPNMTLMLDRMADKGLVERVRSEVDRRAQNVHLTAAGVEAAEQSHQLSQEMERPLLARLSEGERLMLLELLDKVARGR